MLQSLTVKDLMVKKQEYACVSAAQTLGQAAMALEAAQRKEQQAEPGRPLDRAILVVDGDGTVVGKLSMLDVLRGLEPNYDRMPESGSASRAAARVGSARSFIDSMARTAGQWTKPLANLVEKASSVKVSHFVRPFREFETVEEDASLDTALHQLIKGSFQSLLVTRDGEITGILRLTDVYAEISKMLRTQAQTPTEGGSDDR